MYKVESARRQRKMRWMIITIMLVICSSVKSQSQDPVKNSPLASIVKVYNEANKETLTDSLTNINKREALDSGNDSLYIALTFQQFDKRNMRNIDVSGIVLLQDLLVNKIDISEKYLEILLRANLSLGAYFMIQENPSASSLGLAKYYYEKHFKILQELKLSSEELKQFRLHKLDYFIKTKNDSLFDYLDQYSISKEKENLILTKWHRINENHTKELFYATKTSDLFEQMIAFGNNNKIKEADSLYSILKRKYEHENKEMVNILHQKMAHIYVKHDEQPQADELYEKSLKYFEQYNKFYRMEESLTGLAITNCESNATPYQISSYIERLRVFNKTKEKEQLKVLTNHLSLISKVSTWNIKKRVTEKKQIEAQLNIQKTVINLGVGFLIAFAVFIYIYIQRVNESNKLKLANKIMKINVIKSKFKPHFTFNVLSVVNYFIAKKDFENASTSLNKMAGLLRLTLENIDKDLVSYESEYKICEYYMYLEGLRFSEKFDFKIEPLTDLETKSWKLPAGIIEPFLGNSANHAFNVAQKKGLITMSHQIRNECLVITLKDNGSRVDEKILSERLYHGHSISKDIISATSRLYKKKIKLEIKNDFGTQIIITIPLLKPS